MAAAASTIAALRSSGCALTRGPQPQAVPLLAMRGVDPPRLARGCGSTHPPHSVALDATRPRIRPRRVAHDQQATPAKRLRDQLSPRPRLRGGVVRGLRAPVTRSTRVTTRPRATSPRTRDPSVRGNEGGADSPAVSARHRAPPPVMPHSRATMAPHRSHHAFASSRSSPLHHITGAPLDRCRPSTSAVSVRCTTRSITPSAHRHHPPCPAPIRCSGSRSRHLGASRGGRRCRRPSSGSGSMPHSSSGSKPAATHISAARVLHIRPRPYTPPPAADRRAARVRDDVSTAGGPAPRSRGGSARAVVAPRRRGGTSVRAAAMSGIPCDSSAPLTHGTTSARSHRWHDRIPSAQSAPYGSKRRCVRLASISCAFASSITCLPLAALSRRAMCPRQAGATPQSG